MTLQTDASLLTRNTFGIDVKAAEIVDYNTVEELQQYLALRRKQGTKSPMFHIGGGSNLLFLGDYTGTILHSCIRGIDVTSEEGNSVYVRVGAGITWDDFVAYAIDSRWYGLENLSLIPGEVGAAAVQNIGAYGAEAKDYIIYVDTVDLQTGEIRHFAADELAYGYRTSRFKTDLHGRYAVTHVHFRLSHTFSPLLEYGGLRKAVEQKGIAEVDVTASELRQIIIETRRAKLPDPAELGNGGSFFMNPVVERNVYERIVADYPNMPHYDIDADRVKIPAGWLIEQCGWKGRSLGPAAVYDKQALVLVNSGGATGQDILHLCQTIQADVQSRFGIAISPEVNMI